MPKSSVDRTTVKINGVDCTAAFDQIALEGKELAKAQELTNYLLQEHLTKAAKTSIAGRFTIGLSLNIDRLAGRTAIRAKVTYSRKFSEELEGFAQHGQGDLFEDLGEDE